MAIKRPDPPKTGGTPGNENVELLEHLVQKSIAVNPDLAGDRSPKEFITDQKNLRQQQAANSGVQVRDPAERRKKTIEFFMEQKKEEHDDALKSILQEEEKLRLQKQKIQTEIRTDLVDFLVLMTGGKDNPQVKEAIHAHRSLWGALGCTELDILNLVKQGR